MVGIRVRLPAWLVAAACTLPIVSGSQASPELNYTSYKGPNSQLVFDLDKKVFAVIPDGAIFNNWLNGARHSGGNYQERREPGACIAEARGQGLFVLIPAPGHEVRRGNHVFKSNGNVATENVDGEGVVRTYRVDDQVGVTEITLYGGRAHGGPSVRFILAHGPGILRSCLSGLR